MKYTIMIYSFIFFFVFFVYIKDIAPTTSQRKNKTLDGDDEIDNTQEDKKIKLFAEDCPTSENLKNYFKPKTVYTNDNDNNYYCDEDEDDNASDTNIDNVKLFDYEKLQISHFLVELKNYVQCKKQIKNKSDLKYYSLSDEFIVDLYYNSVDNANTAQRKASMQKKFNCFKKCEKLKTEFKNFWKLAQSIDPWDQAKFSRLVNLLNAKKGQAISYCLNHWNQH
ncbi:hypothetical protein RFI_26677 [Reticulomyxa filosa]|uniref:Plasmodium RESA N-terminal domain-containing protein n=1 Tax=Reticulomyxa filosa TaxID=46433 RepID=X6MCD4_RETFI|nr:hypothetical protein RFI_26677 [Reticulomyxa filosa]|eukprot:ETO10700.1 hypothetical protein RFI_26677 [Reticulomyxa filosa]